MITRRHQLVTREGRLRLVRTAGRILADLLPEQEDTLANACRYMSGRLYDVGITGASPLLLSSLAFASDRLDGLTTGRYSPAQFTDDGHATEETRAAMIRGYEVDVRFCEDLAVLPI